MNKSNFIIIIIIIIRYYFKLNLTNLSKFRIRISILVIDESNIYINKTFINRFIQFKNSSF